MEKHDAAIFSLAPGLMSLLEVIAEQAVDVVDDLHCASLDAYGSKLRVNNRWGCSTGLALASQFLFERLVCAVLIEAGVTARSTHPVPTIHRTAEDSVPCPFAISSPCRKDMLGKASSRHIPCGRKLLDYRVSLHNSRNLLRQAPSELRPATQVDPFQSRSPARLHRVLESWENILAHLWWIKYRLLTKSCK